MHKHDLMSCILSVISAGRVGHLPVTAPAAIGISFGGQLEWLSVQKPAVQNSHFIPKTVHFIPKTGCMFAAAFHLIIFYHKLPHISIAYI